MKKIIILLFLYWSYAFFIKVDLFGRHYCKRWFGTLLVSLHIHYCTGVECQSPYNIWSWQEQLWPKRSLSINDWGRAFHQSGHSVVDIYHLLRCSGTTDGSCCVYSICFYFIFSKALYLNFSTHIENSAGSSFLYRSLHHLSFLMMWKMVCASHTYGDSASHPPCAYFKYTSLNSTSFIQLPHLSSEQLPVHLQPVGWHSDTLRIIDHYKRMHHPNGW